MTRQAPDPGSGGGCLITALTILAVLLALLLSGCDEGFTDECPEGTVQTDDDQRVVCVPEGTS